MISHEQVLAELEKRSIWVSSPGEKGDNGRFRIVAQAGKTAQKFFVSSSGENNLITIGLLTEGGQEQKIKKPPFNGQSSLTLCRPQAFYLALSLLNNRGYFDL